MQTRVVVVSAFLLFPATLSAQDTPFRAGQWAAQLSGGLGLASFGVIKFRSPTSAWLMNLDVGGGHRESFINDTLSSLSSGADANLRIGRRWYRPVGNQVVAYRSLGALAGFSHSAGTGGSGLDGYQVGPYGDVGAAYLVSPHFSIGASGQLSITYVRSWGESGGTTFRSWQLSGSTLIAFSATIYF